MATTTDTSDGPMHDLTGFQRDLLVLVERLDDPAGLDIRREMSDAYDGRDINHGRLYPNLDELVDMGLVEKGSQDQRTNWYRLTERGRRELEAHREWMGA